MAKTKTHRAPVPVSLAEQLKSAADDFTTKKRRREEEFSKDYHTNVKIWADLMEKHVPIMKTKAAQGETSHYISIKEIEHERIDGMFESVIFPWAKVNGFEARKSYLFLGDVVMEWSKAGQK
jgi:hypothetical protein